MQILRRRRFIYDKYIFKSINFSAYIPLNGLIGGFFYFFKKVFYFLKIIFGLGIAIELNLMYNTKRVVLTAL